VSFTGVALQNCKSGDLALVVDVACGFQVQSGVCGHESIHVGWCSSIAPQDGRRDEIRVDGRPKHEAVIADGEGYAIRVHCPGFEIGDVALLPEKAMKAGRFDARRPGPRLRAVWRIFKSSRAVRGVLCTVEECRPRLPRPQTSTSGIRELPLIQSLSGL
jgi:hypothetical protein